MVAQLSSLFFSLPFRPPNYSLLTILAGYILPFYLLPDHLADLNSENGFQHFYSLAR